MPIHIKRELYNANDSSKISFYVVPEDCYYLVCEKSNHCADSREIGYFTKNRLIGRANKTANKIQNKIDNRIFELQNSIRSLLKKTQKKKTEKPKKDSKKKSATKT